MAHVAEMKRSAVWFANVSISHTKMKTLRIALTWKNIDRLTSVSREEILSFEFDDKKT